MTTAPARPAAVAELQERAPADVVLSGVTRTYGTTTALDALDLHVAGGEFLAVLGPSGCGKTTALRAIAGAPLGLAVLWIIAVLLWALALYHLIEAFVLRDASTAKTWGRRISEAGQAVVFAARHGAVEIGTGSGATRP